MAAWGEMVESAPDFAASVRSRLDGRIHKTIATIRADGSPRISGIETFIVGDDLWFGSMSGARKAQDLRRDPRFALHSGSVDPPEWTGDAKLSGRAVEVTDPERRFAVFGAVKAGANDSHLFRAEIEQAVLIGLNPARNRLVIELWRPGRWVQRFERS